MAVSYETVRRWVNHFGPMIAADLRKRRLKPHTTWHLDEVYLKIDGRMVYLLRTGCPWRYLPRRVFPPRSTVYNIFRAFQRQGVWEAIWEELRAALRERLGREASPSAGVIDSQSLKSAEKGDARKVKQTQWVMTPARG